MFRLVEEILLVALKYVQNGLGAHDSIFLASEKVRKSVNPLCKQLPYLQMVKKDFFPTDPSLKSWVC
jgi:hypothetical protein